MSGYHGYRGAEETVVIVANSIREPESDLPRLSYNHDLADRVTTEQSYHKSIELLKRTCSESLTDVLRVVRCEVHTIWEIETTKLFLAV